MFVLNRNSVFHAVSQLVFVDNGQNVAKCGEERLPVLEKFLHDKGSNK